MRIASALIMGMTVMTLDLCLSAATQMTPRQIYEGAAPGVVYIDGHEATGKGSAGTGFIIHRDGLVLTNAHVVMNAETGRPYSQILVVFKPTRVTGKPETDYANRTPAQVLALDRPLDLALLKITPNGKALTVLPLREPSDVAIGDWVAAIGHPESGGLWTLATGVVTAEFDDFEQTTGKHVFQTELGLNRGNSGGPLLDADGEVIGINTTIARRAPDGYPITSISFSVKSNVIQHWLDRQGYGIPTVSLPPASEAAPTLNPKTPAPTTEPFRTEVRPYSQDDTRNKLRNLEEDLKKAMDEMERSFR